MAYYGTNMVLAQAHWVSSGSFDLKSSSGFSSVTEITSGHVRCNFSSTLAVLRGANGFHVLNHTTSLVEVVFARGSNTNNNGNYNLSSYNGICVITN